MLKIVLLKDEIWLATCPSLLDRSSSRHCDSTRSQSLSLWNYKCLHLVETRQQIDRPKWVLTAPHIDNTYVICIWHSPLSHESSSLPAERSEGTATGYCWKVVDVLRRPAVPPTSCLPSRRASPVVITRLISKRHGAPRPAVSRRGARRSVVSQLAITSPFHINEFVSIVADRPAADNAAVWSAIGPVRPSVWLSGRDSESDQSSTSTSSPHQTLALPGYRQHVTDRPPSLLLHPQSTTT